MQSQIVKFKGKVERAVWESDTFKIYGMKVNKKHYPDIKFNTYGNVSIAGDLPKLSSGIEYEVTGVETDSKYGKQYKVLNIKTDLPTTKEGALAFLKEILTEQQAENIYQTYPDILKIVKEGKEDTVDLSRIKGVGEKSFQKIIRNIKENFELSDLAAKFQGLFSLNVLKKLYDEYTGVQKVVEEIEKDGYKALTQIGGIGFKTADKLLLDIESVCKKNIKNGKPPIVNFSTDNLKVSLQRCKSCMYFILQENESDGNTKMHKADLRAKVLSDIGKDCAMYFEEAIKDSEEFYVDDTNMDIAIKRTYLTELYIANIINDFLKVNTTWDIDVEQYRTISEDVVLTNEQMQVLSGICKNNITILTANAGCGKSMSVKALINLLEDNSKTYKLFTPTGKSSKVLHEFTNREASTIHRGLEYSPELGWGYDKENKLRCDIVIVDEFSMVDVWLCKHLFDAIDTSKTKLLIIGDNAQLCSVGAGNLLHDMINSQKIPTVLLTKIFRYGEGGLMKVATDVRFEKQYLDSSMKGKLTAFGKNKDYIFYDAQSDKIAVNVVSLYKQLLDKGYRVEDIQVLSAKNVGSCGSIELNSMLQKIANENYGSGQSIKIGDTVYYKGDLVMQTVNNYKAEIYDPNSEWFTDAVQKKVTLIANGETGRIIKFEGDKIIIDFDGTKVVYTKHFMQSVQLGYAISVHKSQGSTIKIVILCTPSSHAFILNSNLLYVGLTRMKEKCFHLGDIATVNRAVKKKLNLDRNTFLKDMLKGITHDMCIQKL